MDPVQKLHADRQRHAQVGIPNQIMCVGTPSLCDWHTLHLPTTTQVVLSMLPQGMLATPCPSHSQAVHAALAKTGGVLKGEVDKLQLLSDEPQTTEYATQASST